MKGREGFKNKTDRSWALALSAIIIQHHSVSYSIIQHHSASFSIIHQKKSKFFPQDPTYKNMVSKGPKMA